VLGAAVPKSLRAPPERSTALRSVSSAPVGAGGGASRPEIARRLGISEATVRSHSKAIFAKLGVNERAHAVAVGFRLGLIG
jgi:FixJ family two-component response regulator